MAVYNYMWSGHNDTEAQRLGVLYGPYALMVAGTSAPAAPDMSFMYNFGFTGSVAPAAGVTAGASSTVGWANGTAQYWATPAPDGDFSSPAMKPGSYTQTLYQGELAVATRAVTVSAGVTTTGQNIDSAWVTPASPVFRIGTWDGTPSGFLNGANLTWMRPSDARMASWGPVTYTVGSSSAATLPACQFKDVNNPATVRFTLTAAQLTSRTVRIGITAAIGTYRGNNALYAYAVPASAFVTGSNTMTITVISGSGALSDWLSPAVSYDCVEMY